MGERKVAPGPSVDPPDMTLTLPALLELRRTPERCAAVTFEAAYRAHRDDVYRAALRFSGGRPGWAEDVTHDAFVKLLEHLPRLDTSTELGGWLYRVTANLAVSRLRRDRSLAGRLARFFTADEADREAAPETRLTLREDAAALLQAVQGLPAQQSVVMTMKVLEGKSQQHIASVLGLSEGYVSKLVAKGFDGLRAAGWDEEGGEGGRDAEA